MCSTGNLFPDPPSQWKRTDCTSQEQYPPYCFASAFADLISEQERDACAQHPSCNGDQCNFGNGNFTYFMALSPRIELHSEGHPTDPSLAWNCIP